MQVTLLSLTCFLIIPLLDNPVLLLSDSPTTLTCRKWGLDFNYSIFIFCIYKQYLFDFPTCLKEVTGWDSVIPLCLSSTQGMACSRMRSSGQSPLSMRTPVKAVAPAGSMAAGRQPSRGLPVVQAPTAGGGRRVQSPGSANGGAYIPGRASTGAGRPVVGRGQASPSASTRSKLSQPPRRWVLLKLLRNVEILMNVSF